MNDWIHKNFRFSVFTGNNFGLSVIEPGYIAGVMLLKNVCSKGLMGLPCYVLRLACALPLVAFGDRAFIDRLNESVGF